MKSYVRVSDILARLQSYDNIDRAILEAKQEIGTNVHAAIAADAKGEFYPLNQREDAYFKSYLGWKKEANPKYLMMESRFFDDNLMITGQIDGLIYDKDGPILIDFKTSAKANEKIWKMQAHFYWYLVEANKVNIGTTMRWINLRQRKVDSRDDEGMPYTDWTGLKVQEYVPLDAKVYEFKYNAETLGECIKEAEMYWEEKANNFDVD